MKNAGSENTDPISNSTQIPSLVNLSSSPTFVGKTPRVNERPAPSSHKNGIVKGNNRVFKFILEKLSKDKSRADMDLIIARASLLINLIFGISKLNSFQLARGYMASTAGIPSKIHIQNLLDADIQMTECRAIQKPTRSRNPRNVP